MKKLIALVTVCAFLIYLYFIRDQPHPAFPQEVRKEYQINNWSPPPFGQELDTSPQPDSPTPWRPVLTKEEVIASGKEALLLGQEWISSLGHREPQKAKERPLEDYVFKRLSGYRMSGRGITNRPGFFELEAFIAPNYPSFTFLPFLELEGLFFDDSTYGANFGLGGRYLPNKFPPLVGFNVFGDYYQTTRGPLFQLSVGFELIAKRWELHTNGYIPLGKKERICKSVFDEYIGDFKVSCRIGQSSYPGVDLDLKLLAVQRKKFFLYVWGGPYFFASVQDCTPSFWGGQFGIQPMYNDFINLSFSVSYDPMFDLLFQGRLMLTLPLYSSKLKGYRDENKWIKRQIYQPVHKLDYMTLDKNCRWHSNF